MNGTRWCSQREKNSMSLTTTISSWFSAKTAPCTALAICEFNKGYDAPSTVKIPDEECN